MGMPSLFVGLPLIKGIFDIGKHIYDGINSSKANAKYSKQLIDNVYNHRLNELNQKEQEILKVKKEYDIRIKEMNEQIKNQNNLYEKMKLENEKKLFELKQREEQRKIEEIQERQIAINQCKEYLNEQFMQCIIESLAEYKQIEGSWIKKINKNDIEKRKKEFSNLFQKLFDIESIQNKISNKFIEIIKQNFIKKELKKMNFMVIGPSGVGKSTLINALLGEELAKTGLGGVCTTEIRKYESKKYPFLCLYDSVGAELGNNHTLEDVQNETINVIVKQLNNSDPNQHIHCIIYCVTFNRAYEEEAKIILKIRSKYDGKKLPIVIAYTMANDDKKVLAVKERINAYLKENKESISEDMFDSFGINFLKLYAKEDEIMANDNKNFQRCFGLSNLINICYKKGEQSYKIAIKNSLIQIAEEYFKNNIKNISKEIENDTNNILLFLEQNFEPNFPDFIAFLFEKITYVENYKNIKINNSDKLEENFYNYNREKKQNEESIWPEKINNKDYESEYKCIFCSKRPFLPLQCSFCGSYACGKCYYAQVSECGIPKCKICSSEIFEDINDNIENNIYDNNNIEKENNINNIEKVIKNNLNFNSIIEINQSIKEFKNEMLKILKNELDNFIEDQSQKIYVKLLEKFTQSNMNQDKNIIEAMKCKEEVK